ncbi:MAG: hypothetical protein ACRYGA_03245 [Janthinobacterium lividum]
MSDLKNEPFVPDIVQEASHAMTIVALVESGLGVALVADVWAHLSPRNDRSLETCVFADRFTARSPVGRSGYRR